MQKNTTKQLVKSLYDLIHQHGVGEYKYDEVMLKMMVIHVLSLKNELPRNIKLNENIAEYKGEWLGLIQALKTSEDSQVQSVFSSNSILEELPMPLVYGLIMTLLKYQGNTIASPAVEVINLMTSSTNPLRYSFYADFSLYSLANAIIGDKSDKTTYVVSPNALPFCAIASQNSDAVYYETIHQAGMIADALSLISENRFHIVYADHLTDPGYKASETELKKFDYGVSFPPMGTKLPKYFYDNTNDSFNRFIVQTKRIESAYVLHLIKQCSQTIVVTVPEGILFSTMEKELRQYLVDNGMLKAVISLPSSIWTGTAIKTSLLVIEPNGNNESVRFLDVTGSEFIEKTTRRLLALTNTDKILSYLASKAELDCAISISQHVIKKDDYLLDCARYILDPKEKNVKKILENSESVVLDNIARFERGLSSSPEEGDYTVLEVGANELNEIGDISPPTKEVEISDSERVKNQAGFLQPNDIILILKGSAGKLGIVPEDVPKTGDRCWMVNRSAIVIRTTSNKVDPKVLYAYLKSDMGQIQISRLIKGATIDNISLKELKNLRVIVPPLEEQKKAIACVDKSRETQKAIQELLSEQYARESELWSL